jgi:beta-lactamase class A
MIFAVVSSSINSISPMSRKIFLLYALMAFVSAHCLAQKTDTKPLKQKLEKIIKQYNATIGVAILNLEDGSGLTVNNTPHYPMLSVFKFPLAIYVLHLVDKGKLSLNQKVHISKEELPPNTWSPLRDKYPEGNIDLPLSELLEYTVSKSDNNGCDILFRLVKGTKPVNDYIHQLGVKNIAIVATERRWAQAGMYSTPTGRSQLL